MTAPFVIPNECEESRLYPTFPGFWDLSRVFCSWLTERLLLIWWYIGPDKGDFFEKSRFVDPCSFERFAFWFRYKIFCCQNFGMPWGFAPGLSDKSTIEFSVHRECGLYHLNKPGEEWRQTGGRKAPDRGEWASRIHFARRRGARAPPFLRSYSRSRLSR